MDKTLKTHTGSYDIEGGYQWIGSDLLVAIWGGDCPHIGAVAAAQPRPGLKDPEKTSATASVICYVGHKDDEIAKMVAEHLASGLNTRVVVTVGIHWDDLPEDAIVSILANGLIMAHLILDDCNREKSGNCLE